MRIAGTAEIEFLPLPQAVAGTGSGAHVPDGCSASAVSAHGLPQFEGTLDRQGFPVCQDRVRTLMRKMGIHAVYQAPPDEHSGPATQGLPVFAAQSDHRPAGPGVGDGHQLYSLGPWFCLPGGHHGLGEPSGVLPWRVSNSMSSDFCVEALQEAIAKFGCPEIFNPNQGSQFTSVDFTDVLKRHSIAISMDGKGRRMLDRNGLMSMVIK